MRDRIKHAMSNTFDVPLMEIADDAEINTMASWDSLSHMILMLELEKEFGVSIPTDRIASLVSLDQIETYLREEVGGEGPAGKVQNER